MSTSSQRPDSISNSHCFCWDERNFNAHPRIKIFGFALVVIALAGSLICLGIGIYSLGACKGLWASHIFSHLNLTSSSILIAAGGLPFLCICIALLAAYCRRKIDKTHSAFDDALVIDIQPQPVVKSEQNIRQQTRIDAPKPDLGQHDPKKRTDIDHEKSVPYDKAAASLGAVGDMAHQRQLASSSQFQSPVHVNIAQPEEVNTEAKRRIEHCIRTGATQLDLSWCGLKSLPKEIKNVKNLNTFILSHNPLEGNFNCEYLHHLNITTLDLSHCQLQKVPAPIGKIKGLQTLKIHNNCFSLLPPEVLAIECLWVSYTPFWDEVLNSFSNKRKSEDPGQVLEAISRCCRYRSALLALDYKHLQRLPNVINELHWLKSLNLRGNQFQDIPDLPFKDLSHVDLSNNEIVSLPIFSSRTRGMDIKLYGNPFYEELLSIHCDPHQSMERTLSALASCQANFKLDLGYKTLTAIPQVVRKYKHLQQIDLSQNYLTMIPNDFFCGFDLRNLKLSFNQLKRLPDCIFTMAPGGEVDTEGNALSYEEIRRLRKITRAKEYGGPNIVFSMPREILFRDTSEMSLDELIFDLCELANIETFSIRNICKEATIQKEFRDWIARLQAIKDFKTRGPAFAIVVCNALKKAEEDKSFLSYMMATIAGSHATCGDRMGLSLIYLDLNYKIAICQDIQQLAYLVIHGMWALSAIEKIAVKKMNSLEFKDEVEVCLAYMIQLRQPLKLPIILEDMLYLKWSDVEKQDVAKAERELRQTLTNRQSCLDILIQDENWKKALNRESPEQFQALENKRREFYESDAYLEERHPLKAQKMAQEADNQYNVGMKKLTQEILKKYRVQVPFL